MISTLFEVGANLVDTILAIYFFTRFHFASLRKNYFVLPFAIFFFGVALVGDRFFPGFTIFPILMGFSFCLAYTLLISKKHYVRAILSTCIFWISYMLISSLLYIIISMVIKDFDVLMQDANTGSPLRYLYLLLGKLCLFMILQLFLVIFRKNTAMELKNSLLAILFTLITAFGLGATMVLTAQPNVAEVQNDLLLIVLAFIAANTLLYILLAQMQKLQQHKYELKLLQETMQFEESRYKELSAIHSNAQKMQHDIKNHLTVISGYLQEEKISDCHKYLQEILEQSEKGNQHFYSGNAVLDYLISAKTASLQDTEVIVSGNAGDFSDMKETDLACLIGNMLDNAIEGLEGVAEKRIQLFFHLENNNQIIICQNTIKHSVLQTNSQLQSTKPDKGNHGLGHKIIAKIVADYDGIYEYYEENGMFGLQVILPQK